MHRIHRSILDLQLQARVSRLILLLALVLGGIPTISWGSEAEPLSTALVWGTKPIPLDTPILKKDGIIYTPILELLPYLQADIRYLKQEDAYTVTIKGTLHQLKFSPNEQTYTVNQTKKKTPFPPIRIDGMLYIPTDIFLKEWGYRITWTKTKGFITPLTTLFTPPETPKEPPQQSIKSITTLTQTYHKTGVDVLIESTSQLIYKLYFLDTPHRLVLDFPHTTPGVPNLINPTQQKAPYTRIRTSQFELNPPTSRIVFDLNDKTSFTLHRQPNGLRIRFVYDTPTPNTKKNTPPPKPKPKPKPLPLEGKLIVIDPGHGGDDPGAIGHDDCYEKEYTLDISKRLERLLQNSGAHIMMCRTGDQNPSLEDRTQLANFNKSDLFISVHINSFISPFSKGTETYYYKYIDEHLAKCVHEAVVDHLQLPDKGTKRARLYVLRNSTMPAVLIEPMFITNKQELLMLSQPYIREKIARAVHQGVLRYYASELKTK
jgi:N-acetylmuramoyl-L-alanine amidase